MSVPLTTRSLRNPARSYFLDSWSKAKSKCFGFTLPMWRSEIYLIAQTVSARSNFTAFRSEKPGKIVFLGLLVEGEFQVFRIHLADVEVGDIPHRTNRKREIEFHRIPI